MSSRPPMRVSSNNIGRCETGGKSLCEVISDNLNRNIADVPRPVALTNPTLVDELTVLSTVALVPALNELIPIYERGGNRLKVAYNTIGELKKRIDAGDTADVIILSSHILVQIEAQRKVINGSIVNIGMSYVGVGVRTGAPLPDISTSEKLRKVLLAAKSIAYADPAKGGASGVYFAGVLDRLGISDQMKAKTVLVPNAQAGELVAGGQVEIDVAQACEIAVIPGTRVVGPLLGDLNSRMVFSAGIGSTCLTPRTAESFIEFLASPVAATVLKSKGMDPV